MQTRFCDLKAKNNTIYDDIHKYCLVENLNEEHIRLSIKKEKWNRKPAKTHRFFGAYLSCKLMVLPKLLAGRLI